MNLNIEYNDKDQIEDLINDYQKLKLKDAAYKEQHKKAQQKYYEANKEKIAIARRAWYLKKYSGDTDYMKQKYLLNKKYKQAKLEREQQKNKLPDIVLALLPDIIE